MLLGGSGGLVAAKFAQNRIIRSNLKNTDIYVINTIRRIIRLCRMTHPWKIRIYTVLANPRHEVYGWPEPTKYIRCTYSFLFRDFIKVMVDYSGVSYIWFWPALVIREKLVCACS